MNISTVASFCLVAVVLLVLAIMMPARAAYDSDPMVGTYQAVVYRGDLYLVDTRTGNYKQAMSGTTQRVNDMNRGMR